MTRQAAFGEPVWLAPGTIIRINQAAVGETGEPFGLRDEALLDSAAARPRHHFLYDDCRDILELACILLFAVARNHPFIQGNKRTGFIAAIVFLNLNGLDLSIADGDELGKAITDVIDGKASETAFRDMLRLFATAL